MWFELSEGSTVLDAPDDDSHSWQLMLDAGWELIWDCWLVSLTAWWLGSRCGSPKHLPRGRCRRFQASYSICLKQEQHHFSISVLFYWLKTITDSKGWGGCGIPLLDGVEQKSICMGENVVANIWKAQPTTHAAIVTDEFTVIKPGAVGLPNCLMYFD